MGDGDAEVLDMFTYPAKKDKAKKKITYPWEFDEDVDTTKASLETAEDAIGSKLSKGAVKDGGLGMIFTYDNTAVQWERNLPYGWVPLGHCGVDGKGCRPMGTPS